MNGILIVYATREGHTRKIAEHITNALRARGLEVHVHDAAEPGHVDPAGFSTVVLAGSLHVGRHERELVHFVRKHRSALERVPSIFLTVSLAEAGAEDPNRTPEDRARFAADVAGTVARFASETGWHPGRVVPVAGALAYTRYNPLVRFVMKQIARRVGASTDTSHDHEYTDWVSLDRLADEVAETLGVPIGEAAVSR
jgi:menaquinone-dependent protoporphyrinogen oxidase